ncbi:FtsK/SpoIIIE domain-containing protein [Brachybacterium paraconglomeratum]|uniref:FtsK/SpoIIIE domain-containing protein n=3 Tax=Brachybacterium TaxID=43668 RepID=UPI00248F5F06|nr:FtsK/SpoIIIE domain-containing protein [Brachybacterium paraconglomeratum]
MDPRTAGIEALAQQRAREHLERVTALDLELVSEIETVRTQAEHIRNLDRLRAGHDDLAQRIHDFIRIELSGSDRAWRLLERKVYAEQPTPGVLPAHDFTLDTRTVDRAFQDVPQLRAAIDLPYVPPSATKARFVEIVTYLESVRHGSRAESSRLSRVVEEARADHARTRDAFTAARQKRLSSLEKSRDSSREEIFRRLHEATRDSTGPAALPLTAWRVDEGEGLLGAAEAVEPLELGGLRASVGTREVPEHLAEISFPWIRDLRSVGNILVPWASEEGREIAEGFVGNLVLRALAAFPAGTLRLAFIDPLGLGRSDAPFLPLGDHNPDLVHRRVRSSHEDIEDLLKELVATIERITQRYLRGTYSSIDEYNEAAEEIAEPYRLLVIHDYPQQFQRGTSLHLLQRVLENGPRCGIHVVISANGKATADHEPGFADLLLGETIDLGSDEGWFPTAENADSQRLVNEGLRSALGDDAALALTTAVVEGVGKSAQSSGVTTGLDRALSLYEKAVIAGSRRDVPRDATPSSLADVTTWWRNSSAHSVVAPVGPSSAREAAVLGFDSESTSSALLIGRPGSGKSTLLHTWMSTLTTLYSPQEVELLLVDFKEGVEFSAYARAGLPHASCIAIESEREFGLSVLQEIESRIKQRSIDFKRAGGATGLESYRAITGETVPRVILVFDEFQVLFAQDDRIGLEAGQLLEKVIRQGRGFGIHVLLGSQSLSGMVAINRQALQMISTRILLPSSADDAALALGENSTAHRLLNTRGEGVMTNEPNSSDALIPFRVAYEPDADREARLEVLRERADNVGFTRRPLVFSSDRVVSRDELRRSISGEHRGDDAPVLTPGASVSLSPPPAISLSREPGRNLLAILRDGDEGDAAFTSGVVEDILTSSENAEILLIPLMETKGFDAYLETLADVDRVRLMSRRSLPAALAELVALVERRQQDGSSPSDAASVLLLHGLHRARDLDPTAAQGFSFDEPAEATTLESLETVLAQGPEVGVHVVAWDASMLCQAAAAAPGTGWATASDRKIWRLM